MKGLLWIALMASFFTGIGNAVTLQAAQEKAGMPDAEYQYKDIAYASTSDAQKMDIFIPAGEGSFPAVLLVHAGGFFFGDKADEYVRAKELVKHGYVAATINYRLSGEALFPANINDVKAAVRYLRANAEKYHIKPEKIGAWGSSAGGNLAALAGTSAGVKALEDLSLGNAEDSSRLQAVVDWYGPTDFIKMDEYFKASGIGEPTHSAADSPESRIIGQQVTRVPELVAKANPETYISDDDPPFLIQHGTEDDTVPTEQAVVFAEKLEKVIGKDNVTLTLFKNEGHGGPQFENADNIDRVMAFFDIFLK